jgi:alpha/beta superfamily hydrolase
MGDVRRLWIEGPAGRLEAAFRVASEPRGAVVLAHPHPLYGGTMHNPVMFHADRALHRDGFTTLRFNFRGVGASEGRHDEGKGEVEDVTAGYSFGSWCAVRDAATNDDVAAVVAIGLPVRSYPFGPVLEAFTKPLALVHGSEDEVAPLPEVRALLAATRMGAKLIVVEGASHLFPGRAAEAGERVVEAVGDVSGQVVPKPRLW